MSDLHRQQSGPTSPVSSVLQQSPAGTAAPPPGYDRAEMGQAPPPPTAPAPTRSELDRHGHVRRTRAGGIWIGIIASAVVLILLIVFLLQNSDTVTIHFLGLSGHLSLAVALFIAAVAGVLLVAIPGTARIIQLRRSVKRSSQPR